MKSFLRNRVVLIGIGVVVLLLSVTIGRYLLHRQSKEAVFVHQPPHPVVIGDFMVPPLLGWNQLILDYPDRPEVDFTKQGKAGKLEICLGSYENRKADGPKNAQQLQSEVARYFQGRVQMLQIINTTAQVSPSRLTSLNGMTAVETPITTRDKFGQTAYAKYTHFINNSHYYLMTSEIDLSKRNLYSPALQMELDQAVATLSKSLVPTPSTKTSVQSSESSR